MNGRKVIYIDEYRKKRLNRQKSLREMIEGHLAEAGRMGAIGAVRNRQKVERAPACNEALPDRTPDEDAG